MITCSFDASTKSTGWAIFNEDKLIDYGVIQPKGEDWRERLSEEQKPLKEILNKYNPEKIYMEDVPLKKANPSTLFKLGVVQGFVYDLATTMNIPICFLLPSEWRSKLGMYDGTREGMKRDVLKHKAILKANQLFNLDLAWVSPKSKKNEDDIAEAILICYSQVKKKRMFRKISKTQ